MLFHDIANIKSTDRRNEKSLNCQKCEGTVVYPEGLSGEQICTHCGLVIDETPTFKGFTQWVPEWYSNWSEKDSETLKEWLNTLRTISCQLNIPNFPYREEAARTLRTQNHAIFRSQKLSKNKRATVAALIHLTLKEYDKLRSLKEISKELSLDPREVKKHAWLLNKTLNEKAKPLRTHRKTAIDYLHEYAGKITKDKQLIINAENTLLEIKKSGGNPIGLGAGAFYNECKKNKTKISKEEIGRIFQISERTVYTNEAKIRKLIESISAARVIAVM